MSEGIRPCGRLEQYQFIGLRASGQVGSDAIAGRLPGVRERILLPHTIIESLYMDQGPRRLPLQEQVDSSAGVQIWGISGSSRLRIIADCSKSSTQNQWHHSASKA